MVSQDASFNGSELSLCSQNHQGIRQLCQRIHVRDWMQLDCLTAEQLKKYAVLAHDILGSYDLAHLALMALDEKSTSDYAPSYLARMMGEVSS
ncbi:MAG: hypothetical protein IPO38_11540 [Rhodocyclaceae bacterium]|nr:hypothetical protein [Rhodocyclaceae bacterium]